MSLNGTSRFVYNREGYNNGYNVSGRLDDCDSLLSSRLISSTQDILVIRVRCRVVIGTVTDANIEWEWKYTHFFFIIIILCMCVCVCLHAS